MWVYDEMTTAGCSTTEEERWRLYTVRFRVLYFGFRSIALYLTGWMEGCLPLSSLARRYHRPVQIGYLASLVSRPWHLVLGILVHRTVRPVNAQRAIFGIREEDLPIQSPISSFGSQP